MTQVFISCVKEDLREADYIVEVLKNNGIDAWLFTRNLAIGQRWQDQIRTAIQNGAHYVPLFSKAFLSRDQSYMWEELNQAVDELRRRPHNSRWFLPISLDGTPPPPIPIRAGETLDQIQWADFNLGWNAKLHEFLSAVGVENPVLDFGEPLGAGLASRAEVRFGTVVYERNSMNVPQLTGQINTIAAGFIARTVEGRIFAQFHVISGNLEIYEFGRTFGLDQIVLTSTDRYLSRDPSNPTRLLGETRVLIPAGYSMPSPTGPVLIENSMIIQSNYDAQGMLTDGGFEGTFLIEMRIDLMGPDPMASVHGRFSVSFM
tara:strand:+ start:335 stop:1285 length:951 start_codon:yes stop_codon:yes gene_type:complete